MGIFYQSVMVFGVKFDLKNLTSNPQLQKREKLEGYDDFGPEDLSDFVEDVTSSRLTVVCASPHYNSDIKEMRCFINVVEFSKIEKLDVSTLKSFLDTFDHEQFKKYLKTLGLDTTDEPCLMHAPNVW